MFSNNIIVIPPHFRMSPCHFSADITLSRVNNDEMYGRG